MLTTEQLAQLPLRAALEAIALAEHGLEVIMCPECDDQLVVVRPDRSVWPSLRAAGFSARRGGHHGENTWAWIDYKERDRLVEKTPEPGMPMTYGVGSDRYAGEVTRIERGGERVVFLLPKLRSERAAKLASDGTYKLIGRPGWVFFGHADEYMDPSF